MNLQTLLFSKVTKVIISALKGVMQCHVYLRPLLMLGSVEISVEALWLQQ